MIKKLLILLLIFSVQCIHSQEIDPDLLNIKSRMDSILGFTADLKLEIVRDFINMPIKHAQVNYIKGKPIEFSSDDFMLIPKRGLDFTLNEIFEYPFITVYRGNDIRSGSSVKVINVIPTDDKADFAIATLYLDSDNQRVLGSEINTKKNGSFTATMNYESTKSILPNSVEIGFEMDRVRIPINFMGKETEIDRKQMRGDGVKTGKIFLWFSNFKITAK